MHSNMAAISYRVYVTGEEKEDEEEGERQDVGARKLIEKWEKRRDESGKKTSFAGQQIRSNGRQLLPRLLMLPLSALFFQVCFSRLN